MVNYCPEFWKCNYIVECRRDRKALDTRAWSLILVSADAAWFHLHFFGKKLKQNPARSHTRRRLGSSVPEGVLGQRFAVMPVKWSVWK